MGCCGEQEWPCWVQGVLGGQHTQRVLQEAEWLSCLSCTDIVCARWRV